MVNVLVIILGIVKRWRIEGEGEIGREICKYLEKRREGGCDWGVKWIKNK